MNKIEDFFKLDYHQYDYFKIIEEGYDIEDIFFTLLKKKSKPMLEWFTKNVISDENNLKELISVQEGYEILLNMDEDFFNYIRSILHFINDDNYFNAIFRTPSHSSIIIIHYFFYELKSVSLFPLMFFISKIEKITTESKERLFLKYFYITQSPTSVIDIMINVLDKQKLKQIIDEDMFYIFLKKKLESHDDEDMFYIFLKKRLEPHECYFVLIHDFKSTDYFFQQMKNITTLEYFFQQNTSILKLILNRWIILIDKYKEVFTHPLLTVKVIEDTKLIIRLHKLIKDDNVTYSTFILIINTLYRKISECNNLYLKMMLTMFHINNKSPYSLSIKKKYNYILNNFALSFKMEKMTLTVLEKKIPSSYDELIYWYEHKPKRFCKFFSRLCKKKKIDKYRLDSVLTSNYYNIFEKIINSNNENYIQVVFGGIASSIEKKIYSISNFLSDTRFIIDIMKSKKKVCKKILLLLGVNNVREMVREKFINFMFEMNLKNMTCLEEIIEPTILNLDINDNLQRKLDYFDIFFSAEKKNIKFFLTKIKFSPEYFSNDIFLILMIKLDFETFKNGIDLYGKENFVCILLKNNWKRDFLIGLMDDKNFCKFIYLLKIVDLYTYDISSLFMYIMSINYNFKKHYYFYYFSSMRNTNIISSSANYYLKTKWYFITSLDASNICLFTDSSEFIYILDAIEKIILKEMEVFTGIRNEFELSCYHFFLCIIIGKIYSCPNDFKYTRYFLFIINIPLFKQSLASFCKKDNYSFLHLAIRLKMNLIIRYFLQFEDVYECFISISDQNNNNNTDDEVMTLLKAKMIDKESSQQKLSIITLYIEQFIEKKYSPVLKERGGEDAVYNQIIEYYKALYEKNKIICPLSSLVYFKKNILKDSFERFSPETAEKIYNENKQEIISDYLQAHRDIEVITTEKDFEISISIVLPLQPSFGMILRSATPLSQHIAYYYLNHYYHTAYRCLVNMSILLFNGQDRWDRKNILNESKKLCCLIWLALTDESVSYETSLTIEQRIIMFTETLINIMREHNRDVKRNVKRRRLENNTIYYEIDDDGKGDKPTCNMGIPSRFYQALTGHPCYVIRSDEENSLYYLKLVIACFKEKISKLYQENQTLFNIIKNAVISHVIELKPLSDEDVQLISILDFSKEEENSIFNKLKKFDQYIELRIDLFLKQYTNQHKLHLFRYGINYVDLFNNDVKN